VSKRIECWQQIWRTYDTEGEEFRFLRCVQVGDQMKFEVVDPERADAVVEVEFDLYTDAVRYLTRQQFVLDAEEDFKPTRRRTPQEKKRLSYERDHHSMPTGKGASRRTQSELPKLRRRQHRHRLKEYVRRESRGLFREVSEQSLRSIRPEEDPEFRRSVPLDEALEEKREKRAERQQTKRKRPKRPGDMQQRDAGNRESFRPSWLKGDEE
jgi:hypothetical protein